MGIANIRVALLAYEDAGVTGNPLLRDVDWARPLLDVPVDNAGMDPVRIAPFDTVQVFDGTRSLTLDNTTELALTLSALDPSTYRLTWTGSGTAPGFRPDRGLALNGGAATVTVFANQTVTITSSLGAVFGAVQVGDTVFIPGLTTGDPASPFNPLNEGTWGVLGASATQLTLVRPAGAGFTGSSETVTITAAVQVQAFGAQGVQPEDRVDVTAGFAASAQRAYPLTAVTANRLEFTSTSPLAAQVATPGAAGLKVYKSPQAVIYVEADQEVAVRTNGATDDTQRIEPLAPGDPDQVGCYLKIGPTYALHLHNRTPVVANCRVVKMER